MTKDNDNNNRINEGHFGGKPGYKNPPKSGQFKLGNKGNKKGRKKEEKDNVCDMVERVLFSKHKLSVNGKAMSATYMEMMLIKMCERAINGEVRAANLMLSVSEKYGFAEQKLSVILPYIPSKAELRKEWAHELEEDDKLYGV